MEARMSTAKMTETFRIARAPQPDHRPSARRMGWILTAGAAALSLLLGAALPARAADKDDLAKALIAALVVGAIIHEANDRDDRMPPVMGPDLIKKKKRHSAKTIPSVCALNLDGHRRNAIVYSERCMRREGVQARLPGHCARDARIWGKRDRIYGERCLREAGFKIEDRRRIY
jgi:hypothetical protein